MDSPVVKQESVVDIYSKLEDIIFFEMVRVDTTLLICCAWLGLLRFLCGAQWVED